MHSLLRFDLTLMATIAPAPDAAIAVADTNSLAGDALPRACAWVKTFVCLGGLDAATFDQDLARAARAPIAGVVLPQCRDGADVQHLAAKLAVAEAQSGRPDGRLGIIAVVAGEPAGVFALGALGGASHRLRALVFDAARLGTKVPRESVAFATARALTILAAQAAGVPAYDQASGADIRVVCEAARRDGFAGLVTAAAEDIPLIADVFGSTRRPAG